MNVQEIREILAEEICHPEYVNDIQVEAMPFTGDYFCSNMYRAKVTLKKSKTRARKGLIVKTLPDDERNLKEMDISSQFNTERTMYGQCLPEIFSQELDLFPNVYLLNEKMLVFDDLSEDGFEMGPKNSLQLAHFELALKGLGRLHAASLAFKVKNSKRFNELASKLFQPYMKSMEMGFRIMGMDSIHHFQEKYPTKVDHPGLSRLKKTFENIDKILDHVIFGQEPWQVICHGDFNRNNMLFKYDLHGDPVAVKFIDLQTSRFTSPVIDLSFFLYLNSNYHIRIHHGDYLLKLYYSQIEERLRNFNLESIYNFDSFLREYSARAFYGYIISNGFIRVCLAKEEEIKGFIFKSEDQDTWSKIKNMGGEEANNRVADIVVDFINNNYWPVGPSYFPYPK